MFLRIWAGYSNKQQNPYGFSVRDGMFPLLSNVSCPNEQIFSVREVCEFVQAPGHPHHPRWLTTFYPSTKPVFLFLFNSKSQSINHPQMAFSNYSILLCKHWIGAGGWVFYLIAVDYGEVGPEFLKFNIKSNHRWCCKKGPHVPTITMPLSCIMGAELGRLYISFEKALVSPSLSYFPASF